jgi:hypothetical protein
VIYYGIVNEEAWERVEEAPETSNSSKCTLSNKNERLISIRV